MTHEDKTPAGRVHVTGTLGGGVTLNDPRLKALRPWPSWAPSPEGLSDADRAELLAMLWDAYDEAERRDARWQRWAMIVGAGIMLAMAIAGALYAWLSPRPRHVDEANEGQACQREAGEHEQASGRRPPPVLGDQELLFSRINHLGNGRHPHPKTEPEEETAEGQLHDAPAELRGRRFWLRGYAQAVDIMRGDQESRCTEQVHDWGNEADARRYERLNPDAVRVDCGDTCSRRDCNVFLSLPRYAARWGE